MIEKIFKKKKSTKKNIKIKNEIFKRTESIRKDVEEERRYFEDIELHEEDNIYENSDKGNI